jgi:hypothetical protein
MMDPGCDKGLQHAGSRANEQGRASGRQVSPGGEVARTSRMRLSPDRLEVLTMVRKRREPIRILPSVVKPISKAEGGHRSLGRSPIGDGPAESDEWSTAANRIR